MAHFFLSVTLDADSHIALTNLSKNVPLRSEPAFYVRDLSAESQTRQRVYPIFKAENDPSRGTSESVIYGRLTDLSAKDRAVSLLFVLPLKADSVVWHDDILSSREVSDKTKIYDNVEKSEAGSGAMSVYPLGTVSGIADNTKFAASIALNPKRPAQFRIGYDAERNELFIRYDIALVPDTVNFASSMDFSFAAFSSDPDWGFRASFAKFMEIFSDVFEVRAKDQGIWMPFTEISEVNNWKDFGFKFHETHDGNHSFDRENGFLPFRYTEPFTWWMNMDKNEPRTYEAAVSHVEKLALDSSISEYSRNRAKALITSGMYDQDGKLVVSFHKYPWCDGACWALNPNPAQPGEINGATINWSDRAKEQRHGTTSTLAGEYIDSVEGYTTPELNFRRDAFPYSTVPLSFDVKTLQPGIPKGLAVFEITRKMSNDMHELGKTLFGNGLPYRFSWLLSVFDIMGTETVWLGEHKEYSPIPLSQLALWRTLSGQKPYLLLQNTNFHAFDSSMVERYFQRSLFFGIYPSMFSVDAASEPYWKDETLYNRDRELFKRYQPLIRELGETGWQPMTMARSSNPAVTLERFGKRYLTALNDTLFEQTTTISLMFNTGATAVKERISGNVIAVSNSSFTVSLKPQSTVMLDFA